MRIFWSRSTGSFFDEAVHDARQILVPDEAAIAALDVKVDELSFEADMEGEESDAAAQLALIAAKGVPQKLADNPTCTIPADAVEISRERHQELMAAVASGKRIVSDEQGAPADVDPALSAEEQVAALRRRRDRDLAASDWTQLPDALTAAKRKLWKEHRQALRDLPLQMLADRAAGGPIDAIPYPEAPA